MDASRVLLTIRVTVNDGKRLIIYRIDGPERRAVHGPSCLRGRIEVHDGNEWVLFEQGSPNDTHSFGLRKQQLKNAWDDLIVEAHVIDGDTNESWELFE